MNHAAHRSMQGPHRAAAAAQRGSFLLEALISLLIIALAVLGLVGLLAHSMQNVDDAKFRGEAAFLANSYISEMWVAKKSTMAANFDDSSGGANYAEFKALVAQRLPNASDPIVKITPGVPPASSATSTMVEVTVTWRPPGDVEDHRHQATATIGVNN